LRKAAIFIVAALLLGSAAVAANLGGARSAALAAIGDEHRNDIIAFASGLNQRQYDTADLAPMPYTGMNPVGVNTFLEQEPDVSQRRETFQMIKDAGIGWIRQQFPWEDIEEPAKGQYWDTKYNHSTWDKYDNIVQLAQEYGIQVIARLDLPPHWAHPGNEWAATPPDNLNDYGDYVYAVVSRYKGKIKYYQLWNEPNLYTEWGRKSVDAKQYVQLLKIGYERAKEADPNCVIISAALAPTIEQSWEALDDRIYLQQMYDAGAKSYFDIMSVMAYGLRSGPYDRRLSLGDVNFSRPILTREIMVKNGDADKPIWASEMGWNSQPEPVKAPPVFGQVSEELQARYTVQAFQRAADEWPWMGVMSIWFFKRADDHEQDQPFYYFRMVDPDFTPRPPYQAVKEMTKQPPVLHMGHSWADNWALHYNGNWQSTPQPNGEVQMATSQAGATLSFEFKGNDLTMVAPEGKGLGSAEVTIDGRAAMVSMLQRDSSGQAILDLQAPHSPAEEQIPVTNGLLNDVHTVEIKTQGPFAVDGFIVEVHGPTTSWWLIASFILVALPIAAGMTLIVVSRRRRARQSQSSYT